MFAFRKQNRAVYKSKWVGMQYGGHGAPTRAQGMLNLFSSLGEFAKDANLFTTVGSVGTDATWVNLPPFNDSSPYGTLVTFPGRQALDYTFYGQLHITSGGLMFADPVAP